MMIDGILRLTEWQAVEVFPQFSSTVPAVQRESLPLLAIFFLSFFCADDYKASFKSWNQKMKPKCVFFAKTPPPPAHCI